MQTSPTVSDGLIRYQPALDGMRAIAILAVILYHVTPVISGGWAGVDVFFVLSGYLITRIIDLEIEDTGHLDFKRFYIRRALRLLPALSCVVAFECALGAFSHHPLEFLLPALMAAVYLMNWNRAFSWFPEGTLGHTWSLSVEEQFYIIWPGLFRLIRNRRPLLWIAAGIVLVISWRVYLVLHGATNERTYSGLDTHSEGLLIGCGLALIKLSPGVRQGLKQTALVPCFLLIAFFVYAEFNSGLSRLYGMTVASILSAWIMSAALEPGWLQTALSVRPLVYTGRISYGWYLWHYPIFLIGQRIYHNDLFWAAVAYLIAVVSYEYLERPFLRLKSHFEPEKRNVAKVEDKWQANGISPAGE